MRKLIKKSFHRKEEGFTLIELLIVIVIIGILAGVLIAVINPVRQQNRSRNAAVRAAILKAAFAVNTVRAGIGTLPSNSTLDVELENMQAGSGVCNQAVSNNLDCYFTISGTQLPAYCDSATDSSIPVSGGADVCYIHLVNWGTDLRDGQFRIAAPKWTLDTANGPYEYYLFDSSDGLLRCPYTATGYGAGTFDWGTSGCVVVVDE